jgi:hypothetical protein
VSNKRTILLFIIGLTLTTLSFPISFIYLMFPVSSFISIVISYIMDVIALIIGIYLLSRSGRETLSLALGILLIFYSVSTICVTILTQYMLK